MYPSFTVLFWAQSTRRVSDNQLKYSRHKSDDVLRLSVPSNNSDLFTKVNEVHTHKIKSSSSGNFYIKSSSLSLNQRSFARFGA